MSTSKNKVIFHGGCHSCKNQNILTGTLVCRGCQYRNADWDKPNLNTEDIKDTIKKAFIKLASKISSLKIFSKFSLSPKFKKMPFHGGCLGCVSQEQHGLRRCTGCQYFDADWSLPDLSIKNK